MAEPTSTVPVSGTELRLVLFGLPAAGKSSLLGALAEAAKTQEHLLGGRLIDRTHGMEELAESLYQGSGRRTAEEVVPYPIEYHPFSPDGQARLPTTIEALVIDCDGRIANDLLLAKQSMDEDSPDGTLAHEVVEADTLILVVDGAAPPAQIEADFAEFHRFLKLMERSRGQRTEVGGLPVFLVLTKCDLLAHPGDSPTTWMERIEQRKRDVDAHFREFLAREEAAKPPALGANGDVPQSLENTETTQDLSPETATGIFGRIDLHIWATAVKRPALKGVPPKPREPYAVAELFRQCLNDGQAYRERCQRSSRRLASTVFGATAFVFGMLALAAVLFLVNRNTRVTMLAERVEDFRFLDRGSPAERLKGTPEQLKEKLQRLQAIHDDPLFSALKPELRAFVDERLEELHAYIPYLEKVLAVPSPAVERTEEGLNKSIEQSKTELAPPKPEWAGTQAALLVRQRLDAGEALKRAVQTVVNWYLDDTDNMGKLWTFAGYRTAADIDWADWTALAEKETDPNRKPPFNEAQPIPGAPGSSLTYGDAMRFDKVDDVRTAWKAERARLRRLLEVCSALGLATPSKERPAVLVIPRNFTLKDARERVAELKRVYPDFKTTFVRDVLPDILIPRVQQVARSQYRNLLIPGRAEVLRRLRLAGTGTEETVARWEAVRTWLREPEELAAWRVPANVLLRLDDPAAEDPVTELFNFLGKKEFPIEIDKVTLEIPELRGLRPRPESRLVILHPASDRQPALAFAPSGDPRLDAERRVRIYTFRLQPDKGRRLVYRPGDKLWAELPLSGGKERLAWADSRSSLYQFERLRNPPRRQPSNAASLSEGRELSDVRLILSPEEGVPRVPDLIPKVRLED